MQVVPILQPRMKPPSRQRRQKLVCRLSSIALYKLHPLTIGPTDIPPIDAQIKTVVAVCEAAREIPSKEGDKVFLVSKLWLNRVISRGSEARQSSKIEPEGEIGPVDNSDIIQQVIKDCDDQVFIQLKQGLGTESFEMFPEDAWNMVMDWYGLMPGSGPIIRYAHNTNPDKTGIPNVTFEFHPPIFVLHRLWSDSQPTLVSQLQKTQNPAAPLVVVSRSDKYVHFLKRIKKAAGIDISKKVRVWRVPRTQPAAEPIAPMASTVTPPSSRPSSGAGNHGDLEPCEPQDSWEDLLLDVATFLEIKKGTGGSSLRPRPFRQPELQWQIRLILPWPWRQPGDHFGRACQW